MVETGTADALLEVDGIETCYGLSQVLFGLSLSIHAGEMVALMGRNGMGKTTTIRSIMGMTPARAGTIRFAGEEVRGLPSYRIAKLGIGLVPEGRQIFPNLTVLQNIEVALQRQAGLASQFWRSQRILGRLRHRAFELLAAVGLDKFSRIEARSLPYGRKRTLEIATTLALEPKLLLLDEPMAGMGHEDIATISTLIRSLAGRYAIIMIEHNLSVVSTICDQITVLPRGAVIAEGPYSEVNRNPAARDA